MKRLLWLDDLRDPNADGWVDRCSPIKGLTEVFWAKNYTEFTLYLEEFGIPDAICFDHDLGICESGYDCAKYLVNYCMERDIDIPKFSIHSMNPVGAHNIEAILLFYHTHYLKSHNVEIKL
jgi:hypothetical protein